MYFIESAEISYGCGFTPLKKLKKWTANDLFLWKDQNNVRLGIYKKAKIKYEWGFISKENAKIKHSMGFITLKRLEEGTVEDLFHQ